MEYYVKENIDVTEKVLKKKNKKQKKLNMLFERYNNQFNFIKNYLQSNHYILDVGCREGVFLNKLKLNGYINTIGIDVSDIALQVCSLKHECYNMNLMNIDSLQKFDFIIVSHVLEHIPQPNIFIDKVYEQLNTNGFLFIEIPLQKKSKFSKRKNGHFSFFSNKNELIELLTNFKILKDETIKEAKGYDNYRLICRKITHE